MRSTIVILITVLAPISFLGCKPPKEEKKKKIPSVLSVPQQSSSSLSRSEERTDAKKSSIEKVAGELVQVKQDIDTELLSACTFPSQNSNPKILEYELLKQTAGVEHLLHGLAKAKAANDGKLLFMDIYWLGCRGCRELLSTDKDTITQIEEETHAVKVSWKTSKESFDPLTAAYMMFTNIVSEKTQSLDYMDNDGLVHTGRQIEDYSTHDRVHFPQLLFLNPTNIFRKPLMTLCELQKANKLFTVNPQTLQPELNDASDMLTRNLLTPVAVYSQLLNENIFTENNRDLNEPVVMNSFSAAKKAHSSSLVGTFEPMVGIWNARLPDARTDEPATLPIAISQTPASQILAPAEQILNQPPTVVLPRTQVVFQQPVHVVPTVVSTQPTASGVQVLPANTLKHAPERIFPRRPVLRDRLLRQYR